MALRIIMSRFHRKVDEQDFKAVMAELERQGHTLLLASANNAYFGALGITPDTVMRHGVGTLQERRVYLEGDLIPASDWNEVVYVALRREFSRGPGRPPRKSRTLDVGAITTGGTSLLQKVRTHAESALGSKRSSPKAWAGRSWTNQPFSDLLQLGTFLQASPGVDSMEACDALGDDRTRKLAAAVKSAGGMLSHEFEKLGGTDEDAKSLQSKSLAKKELVLICKRTSKLINRLPSRDILQELDKQGVICASCGKKLSEERLDELLVPTELARELLDHSRWMASILVRKLEDFSIPPARVLLEFQEGAEEVDAFVDVDGTLVMVELKDKEFSMRQAYPVSGRIAMYHPAHVVIVTSDRVAPEVREYFDRIEPEAKLTYVEGLDSLTENFEKVISLIRGEKVTFLLERFNPLTIGVDIPSLIANKMGIAIPDRSPKRPTARIGTF